ncbi:MAG: DUF2752 domain-containing protein [Clostridia bacterium]
MNRLKNLLILAVLVIFIIQLNNPCIFKEYFSIACPSCGMTRAFIYIFKFDFLAAISYNILSIPLAIFLICGVITISFDIIRNTDMFITNTLKLFEKYWLYILVLLVLSFIINNIKNI